MNRLRIGGLIVLALLAIGVFMSSSPRGYGSDISGSISVDELNEESAQGAPQQTVVNGWVARDLLEIIAKQNDERSSDDRVPALLTIAVLAGIWTVLTAPKHTEPGPAHVATSLIPTQPPAPASGPVPAL